MCVYVWRQTEKQRERGREGEGGEREGVGEGGKGGRRGNRQRASSPWKMLSDPSIQVSLDLSAPINLMCLSNVWELTDPPAT